MLPQLPVKEEIIVWFTSWLACLTATMFLLEANPKVPEFSIVTEDPLHEEDQELNDSD